MSSEKTNELFLRKNAELTGGQTDNGNFTGHSARQGSNNKMCM